MKKILNAIYVTTGIMYALSVECTHKLKIKIMKPLKSLLKTLYKALNIFRVEAIIAILGVIALIAWLFGVKEAFLGIGFTLHSVYTAFRLYDCTRRGKELEDKVYNKGK